MTMTKEELKQIDIVERPDLLDIEKETYISCDSEDIKAGYCNVASFHKLIIKQVLKMNDSKINKYYIENGDLNYIEATVDLSCLKLKSKSNKSDNTLSRVVRY